eukprot:7193721-Prorocentrum_lima.AAC.1
MQNDLRVLNSLFRKPDRMLVICTEIGSGYSPPYVGGGQRTRMTWAGVTCSKHIEGDFEANI